jgi:hypothetical protein
MPATALTLDKRYRGWCWLRRAAQEAGDRPCCCHSDAYVQVAAACIIAVNAAFNFAQVPNEVLMKCDIENITESQQLLVRMHFEVDSKGVTADIVHDLASMVQEMMDQEDRLHLYDNHFHPHAVIQDVGESPLWYKARAPPAAHLWQLDRLCCSHLKAGVG